MRISDWSSDVCSSDLLHHEGRRREEPQSWRAGTRRRRPGREVFGDGSARRGAAALFACGADRFRRAFRSAAWLHPISVVPARSEEHTSELQSLMRISYAVFCLKKKKKEKTKNT